MADTTAGATPATTASDDEELPLITLFEANEECICEFGDIVLCADDGFHAPQRLRVSSCILAMRSKPFKALFSKKFMEGSTGSDRSSRNPHDVHITDSPTPLKHLCQLLHLSPVDADRKPLAPFELLELGLLADKYDVVEAIRLQTKTLLGGTCKDTRAGRGCPSRSAGHCSSTLGSG